MAIWQMMPPPDGSHNPITVGGRVYSCAVGSTISVPSTDGYTMSANGWIPASVGGSGPTSSRPDASAVSKGAEFHDTTLGKVIVFDGKGWRDPHTGASA